jgi:hypothetical protein
MKRQNNTLDARTKKELVFYVLLLGLLLLFVYIMFSSVFNLQNKEDKNSQEDLVTAKIPPSYVILPNNDPHLVKIMGLERALPDRYRVVTIFKGKSFISDTYYCEQECIAIEIYDNELAQSIAFVSDYLVYPQNTIGDDTYTGEQIDLFGKKVDLIVRKTITEEETFDYDETKITPVGAENLIFSAYACSSNICVASLNFPFDNNIEMYYESFREFLNYLK